MTFMAGASAAGLACCHRARFSWLTADGQGCARKGWGTGRRPKVRLSGETGSGWPTLKTALLTQCMVRPCVARGFRRAIVSGLASMYPVSDWSCFAPDHHGYQRACDLISGKTDPPSLLILSQTSAGNGNRVWDYVIAFPFNVPAIRRVE